MTTSNHKSYTYPKEKIDIPSGSGRKSTVKYTDFVIKEFIIEANHPPIPALGCDEEITVKSGEIFGLDASGATDPDGDSLSYWWFQYPESGSYKEEIKYGLSDNLYFVHTIGPLR